MQPALNPVTAVMAVAILGGVLLLQALVQVSLQARRRDRAWAEVERWLHERHGLAPRLASIASLYIPWNDPRVKAVGAARRAALQARDMVDRSGRETDLSLALGRLMVAMKECPELARHADMAAVRAELARAENGAAAARLAFNREAETLARELHRPLGRLVGYLRRLPGAEPFDVDPYLAREAVLAQAALAAAPNPGA